MNLSFTQRHPNVKDALNLVIFAICVAVGTIFINSFIFRTFSVVGPSMEPTMHTGDRLIVNRIPVTMSSLKNELYMPKRGEIIVFENPRYDNTSKSRNDQYIVKRVIAFPGERVVVKDGSLPVFNNQNPKGFNPDKDYAKTLSTPTSGDFNGEVPQGSIFVSGDHRNDNFSYDSRNGLGYIPMYRIVGPVSVRIWPLNKVGYFSS